MNEMNEMPVEGTAPAKNNRNVIIGVVAAVVLCCLCIVGGGVGYYIWTNF